MSADIIKLLRKAPIFSTLDSSGLKKISGFFKERTYSAEEVFFREGTLGDTLYIIRDGAIKIGREAKEGEEETSQVLRREGDIFGESGFLDESPRPATAKATKTTNVLQLSRSDFLTILNDHPLVAYQVVKILSSRLKQSDLRAIEELREKNEQLQKAYHALLEFAKSPETKGWSNRPPEPKKDGGSFSDRVLSFAPYAVICTRDDDSVSFLNKAAEKEFGCQADEATGKTVKTFFSQTSWSSCSPAIQKRLSAVAGEMGFWEGETIARRKNGQQFVAWTTVSQIFAAEGREEGRLYIIQDVTDERIQQREMRMCGEWVAKQETTEQMANSLRGEFEALSAAFETLPFELDQENLTKTLKTLTQMRNALDNLRKLIPDKTPSVLPEPKKEPLDPVSFFEEESLLLKSCDKFRGITIDTHFEADTPKIEANRGELKRLFDLILDNAAFALQSVSDRMKTITVEVGPVNQKREVQIQISDNGIGISPANLAKAFKEPFTTKKDGLGFGLLSAARIVKNHGGTVEVESDEGTYTLLVIKLPAYVEEPASITHIEPVSKTHH
ncbi:MAG: cyclic nucleotide-binding domain-containing protein [Candidatus Zixiibacteriota bacterium]